MFYKVPRLLKISKIEDRRQTDGYPKVICTKFFLVKATFDAKSDRQITDNQKLGGNSLAKNHQKKTISANYISLAKL